MKYLSNLRKKKIKRDTIIINIIIVKLQSKMEEKFCLKIGEPSSKAKYDI